MFSKIIIKVIFIFLMELTQKQDRSKIVYVADTMCSWSYGFAPQIKKIKEHFHGRLDVELVNGGLRPYGTRMISESASFLEGHWREIEEMTSQPFNYNLLKSKTFVVDTEPPARAVVAVRQMHPEHEFDFFLAVQEMIFVDNKDQRFLESYTPLLKKFRLDEMRFQRLFESSQLKERTEEDFVRSSRLGVSGFPSLLLIHNGKIVRISAGYTTADKAIASIERLLEN